MAYKKLTDEEKELRIEFGKRLRNARIEADLTQVDLAELLGLKIWNISDMENGKIVPSKQRFGSMCELLNKEPKFFFPDGTPDLFDEAWKKNDHNRRQHQNKPWQGRKSVNPDEQNINFDIEDHIDEMINTEKNGTEDPVEIIKDDEKVDVVVKQTAETPDKTIKRKITISIPNLTQKDRDIKIEVEEEV